MRVAQIIMICLFGIDLGINLVKHKEEKTGSSAEYNFWIALVSVIIEAVILYFGGFWG